MAALVPGQIVFLACSQTRLYAEVIQILTSRQIGWIRPLALVSEASTILLGTDWRSGATAAHQPAIPDMLWPLSQLQPALDTDVMPLLTTLAAKAGETDSGATSHIDNPTTNSAQMTVTGFVQQLWAENPPELENDSLAHA